MGMNMGTGENDGKGPETAQKKRDEGSFLHQRDAYLGAVPRLSEMDRAEYRRITLEFGECVLAVIPVLAEMYKKSCDENHHYDDDALQAPSSIIYDQIQNLASMSKIARVGDYKGNDLAYYSFEIDSTGRCHALRIKVLIDRDSAFYHLPQEAINDLAGLLDARGKTLQQLVWQKALIEEAIKVYQRNKKILQECKIDLEAPKIFKNEI